MSRELQKPRARAILRAAPPPSHRMASEDRREQLINVAIRLFSRKGFSGTTTKEVARAAGVNQAILFRHFATKEELYAAILEHKASTSRADEWLEELRGHAERRDDEALFRAVVAKVLEHGRRDRDFMRLMLFSALEGHELARSFREKRVRPVFNFLRDYVALRQSEGVFRRGDPGVAVRAFFSLPTYHAQSVALFNCHLLPITDEEAAVSFTRLILDGLRRGAGRKPARKRRGRKPTAVRVQE